MCTTGTGEWSLALWVHHPLWFCMWGCCGDVLLRTFAEKSSIYLEPSQCCVILCQRAANGAKPFPQRWCLQVGCVHACMKCCFSWFLTRGVSPRAHLVCKWAQEGVHLHTPLPTCCFMWPEGYCGALGLGTNPFGVISCPQIHVLKAQTVWLFEHLSTTLEVIIYYIGTGQPFLTHASSVDISLLDVHSK